MSAAPQRSKAAPGFTYDRKSRRYRGPNGRFVSESRILEIVENEITARAERMQSAGRALSEGRITLERFGEMLRAEIRTGHLAGGVIGRGGFAQMAPRDNLWIGRRIQFDLQKANAFLRDIAKGKYGREGALLDGRFLNRLDQYAQSGYATQVEMTVRVAEGAGAKLVMRILKPGDNCKTGKSRIGCVEAARRGPVPIGSARDVPHGQCTCLRRCRCRRVTDLDVARIPKRYRGRMVRAIEKLGRAV
jgi:hypothetical protein